MRSTRVWIFRGIVGFVILVALVLAFMPKAVPVDITQVTRGSFEVSVRDDGHTRVREIYTVSSPLTGRVLRFSGEVGDYVEAGETVLATILPADPAILDVRTRSELEGAVRASEAALSLAEAEVARALAARDFALSEFQRTEELARRGAVSEAALDRARLNLRTQNAARAETDAALRVRQYELETAQAALIGPEDRDDASGEGGEGVDCCIAVRAPVSGRILRIYQESEAVVAAGSPLVELGDPQDLEIVIDLLSTDAVRVEVGALVAIERWGGEGTLNGEVERVEPYGFTKVSSLGIEEQRVNVIIRLTDSPELWTRLGHGYRVEGRVILWRGDGILQVPLSALFRDGEDWAVFRVRGGRARLQVVEVGRFNTSATEITAGLEEGDTVLTHPSDRVSNGTLVEQRGGN